MFLHLAHTKLDSFNCSQELALECHETTKLFPESEKFALLQQLRTTALSVHPDIAGGCSRKSISEWKKFIEISRVSGIKIDAAIGIAYKLSYITFVPWHLISEKIIKTLKILSGMMAKRLVIDHSPLTTYRT